MKTKAEIVDTVLKEAKSPKGWEKSILRMKKHKEIDNPWALSWWMKNKGYKPHPKKAK